MNHILDRLGDADFCAADQTVIVLGLVAICFSVLGGSTRESDRVHDEYDMFSQVLSRLTTFDSIHADSREYFFRMRFS